MSVRVTAAPPEPGPTHIGRVYRQMNERPTLEEAGLLAHGSFSHVCVAPPWLPLRKSIQRTWGHSRRPETCDPPLAARGWPRKLPGAGEMSPGSHCGRVLAPVGLCPPHGQGHRPHRRGQSAPPLGAGRRQRLPGPQHRQRCSLLSPTFPGESPKPPGLARTGSYGGGRRAGPRTEQTRAAPRPVAAGPGLLGCRRPRAGLSPSEQPAPSRVLCQGPSAGAAAAQPDGPAPRPPRGAHLAPRRRAPASPPGSYLLSEREKRRRHLPTDPGPERRRRGRACALCEGRCVRSGAREWAWPEQSRAGVAEPNRGGVEGGVQRALHGLGPRGRASGLVRGP